MKKILVAMVCVLLSSGCGSDDECGSRQIQSVRDCCWNWNLYCHACTVKYADQSEAVKCEPFTQSCGGEE